MLEKCSDYWSVSSRDFKKSPSFLKSFYVDPLGLEPRMTIPKTVVLPITPWVNLNGELKMKNGKLFPTS